MTKKKIVMIGGGTGTFAILSGLKKYDELELSAVVAVTDNGGSSGVLRDEFGFLPPGDLRQCIVALSGEGNGDSMMRELFNYRFQKGGAGLEGHSFGNLFLTALTDVTGSTEKALEYASKILRIKGNVIPVSLDNIDLAIEQEDGTVTVGETNIKDNYEKRDLNSLIKRAWLQPKAHATPKAIEVIKEADLIIIGPGGLYTSLIANILVDGIKEAILDSKAKILYNVNLMQDSGQTFGLTAKGHVETISKYIGKYPDFVLINNKELPKDIVQKYIDSDDYPVENDLQESSEYNLIREDLITGSEEVEKKKDFGAKRSLIRHNSERIARIIVEQILK